MSVTTKSWTLYWAFRDGNVSLSTKLLADLSIDDVEPKLENITGLYNDTLLHLACRHGWLDLVKRFIEEHGFAPDIQDHGKQTPLHYACHYGQLDIVQYLTTYQQCDATATTLDHWTPLHYACRYGYMSIVEYLTSLTNVVKSIDQSSVLHLTCKHGNSDILIYLMDKKGFTAGPIASNEDVQGLLLTACQHEHTQIVHHLLKVVSSYQNIELEECKAVFMFCCKNGLSELLKRVTHEVCEVAHAIDESGKSGIHYASQKGHTAVIQHLVEQCGCNINTPDKDGFTPLHLACKYGQNVDSVKYILSRPECNFSVLTHDGSTMLHCASMTEEFDSQLMNVLTKHGASVSKEALSSIQTYFKSSESISNKPTVKSAIIACLFEITKCAPNAKNYAGFSPVQISTYPFIIRRILACHKETKIYEWIQCEDELQAIHESKCYVVKCELDLDETASNGDSVLHMACVANKAQIAEYLLQECSFNPNIKNSAGDTPLSLALRLHTYKMLPNFNKNLTGLISLFVNDPRWNPALDKKDRDGNNLLHLACQANQQELISALEKLGDKLGFSQNSNGLLPFESLSNTNIIISYALKGSFTYTFKPGSLHQFICFCNNMESGQLEKIILNESSNKINWEHTRSNFCQIGHHILHLRNHQICLLMKVCFHSKVSLQSTEPLDTRSTIKHPKTIHSNDCNHNIFVMDIVDHLIHGSFKDDVSNEELLYTACRRNRYHFVEHLILALKCNPNLRAYESEDLPITLTNKSNIMQLLIQHGAKVQLDFISKLFTLSSEEDIHPDTFRILKKSKQWYPDFVCNSNGDTALHLSVRCHRYQLAHYLISEAKCVPNIKNKRGETPIQLMISVKSWSDSECMNIVNTLISTGVWHPNSTCNSNGDKALHLSVRYHRYQLAHYLVSEAKCDPNIKNKKGESPILLMIYIKSWSDSECVDIIDALISTGVWDPNSTCNSNGDTALHLSAKFPRYEVANYLLTEAKCDPSIRNLNGVTQVQLLLPLMISRSDSDFYDLIKALIPTKKWDPNSSCNSSGDTALHLTMRDHKCELVKYLLTEVKCDPYIKNQRGETSIQLMIYIKSWSDSECVDIIDALISTGVWDPNSTCNSNGDTALHLSAKFPRYEVANYLLTEAKCDPNIRNLNGVTQVQLLLPLMISRSDSDYNLIKALISTKKWDPNSSCNSSGDTALHLTMRHHKCELAKYLLTEVKCDPNIKNQRGETPIQPMISVQSWSDSEYTNIINALISTGVWDPNSTCNSNGDTALHLSVRCHRYKVVQQLLTKTRSNPNIQKQNGETSIQLLLSAKSWSHLECLNIIKVLTTTGLWNPNSSCNSNGDTVLHLSARHHRYEVTLYFLSEMKCDPNIKNLDGKQPIDLILSSESWSDFECIEIIKLMSSLPWDPNSSYNSNGDTALHLSARHHRYEVTLYLLSELKCDPNIKKLDGKQPIDLILSSESWSDFECIEIIKLMSSLPWDPNSSCNSNGDTVLHLSARHHRYKVTHYFLSEMKCDPNINNLDGKQPIDLILSLESWSGSECIEIIKLMSSLPWDPNSSCNSNEDTALHLSARHHKYEVTHYLLSEMKCDPNLKNLNGVTLLPVILRTWSDFECECMIKALISTEKWNCNSSCNSGGDTALHLSARYHRTVTVHLLLSEAKCDPNIRNIDEETPLQAACNTSVINDLIRHGAKPKNVYKSLGKSVGLTKPLVPPVKVFIIGNSGVGKSTLTEALKIETSFLVRAFTTRKKVSGVNEKTAGVVPHEFESKLYGRVIFYDFAGQREFYNSHIAILQNVVQSSSPIFLIVVNLSHSEEEIQQNIHYWLSFLELNCHTAHCKPHVIIVGSHADIALNRGDAPHEISSKMSNYVQEISQDFTLEYVGMYPIDCRYPESPIMTELRGSLKDSCKSLRIPDTISFNSHCFHVFLLDTFRASVAATIHDLRMEIEKVNDIEEKGVANYLPKNITTLSSVCDELNDRGHILFLKNNDNLEKSWVIIDKVSLLSKVTGTIFAPNDFKEHCQIAESTGVVPLSRLIINFPDYKSEVLIGFLTHLEYCHEIDDCEVHELISNHQDSLNRADAGESENERYFLFPGLITLNAPRGIWKQNQNFKYHCFWIIQCTRQDQFFTSRFTQVLLLRLAFSFALIKKEVNPAIPALQRECSIWKNGIFWGEIFGMEIIVEIHSSKVIFLMCYQEENILHCIAKRSSIIQKISQCVHDLCSNTETVESFIDPSEATEFPLKSPVSPETPQFSLQKIAETIVKSTDYRTLSVVSSTGTISLDYILTFEPYAELGMAALKKLCTSDSVFEKKISDSFLKHLSRKFSKKAKLFIELFSSAPSQLSSTTSEDHFTLLKTWRDECNGTYKCLKEKLDQFSVFAGRNVLVSKLLHMHFKIPFVYCVSLTWCFHFFYMQKLSAVELSQDDSELRDSDNEVFSEFPSMSNSPEQVHSKGGQSLNSKTVQVNSKDGQINLTKEQLSSKDDGIDSKDDTIKSKKNNFCSTNDPSSPPEGPTSASSTDGGALTSAINYDEARKLSQQGISFNVDENEDIDVVIYSYFAYYGYYSM